MPSSPQKKRCGGVFWLGALLLLGMANACPAAQIGELVQTSAWEQALRFFSFRDPSLRFALAGSLLLGVCCGLLGSFLVVRKMALVGDALSHAVLPGVALGFLWNMSKDPVAIFVGATVAGLLGTTLVTWITRSTRLKEDAALGMVLATFFAVGICLVTMIQALPTGHKSGIDKFLFGQAAALGADDVKLLAGVSVFSLAAITLLYRPLLVTSFDPAFARAIGLPTRLLHELLMLLLAFSVVVALQAVGVVLVSAMLITPAATAYLLTDRMHRMLILASLFGLLSAATGAFLSFLGNNLPTGPFMVLGASTLFLIAFFCAPKHGVLPRWWRHLSRSKRIQRENMLGAIYRALEDKGFAAEGVGLDSLGTRRREPLTVVRHQLADLERNELVTLAAGGDEVFFTPAGRQRAVEVVRNHRLWELYLTNAADYAVDHVHDDAEKIEHVLGEEIVRQLERRLAFPSVDPHGKRIPEVHLPDDRQKDVPPATTGYGG